MRKPIICLDFDGVIHSYGSGWKGAAVIPDPPVLGAMQFLRALFEDGRFTTAIHSSRSKSLRGRWAMQRYIRRELIEEFGHQIGPCMDPLYIEILDAIRWPWFKPAAFLTIDDRALTFRGVWPELAALSAFRTWRLLALRDLREGDAMTPWPLNLNGGPPRPAPEEPA